MVPGRVTCWGSTNCSPPRNWPAAMKSCTSVTTIGMIVMGFDTQVASAAIPTFMTCPSICPKPACRLRCPAPSGIRTPAGRRSGLTMSPTRRLNCSTCPLTPARMTVFARSASAWASAASALAFSAGRSAEIFASAPCLVAVAAAIAPLRPFRVSRPASPVRFSLVRRLRGRSADQAARARYRPRLGPFPRLDAAL